MKHAAAICAAAAAIVAFYVVCLGAAGLAEPDEARYAEIGREMVESGDWITPRQNYVKYFEKPALGYWMIAGVLTLAGPSEFALRLIPALCGLLTILLTYVLARDMYGRRTARLTAVLLATSPFFFALSQVLILDMPMTAAITGALTAFWFAWTRGPATRAGATVGSATRAGATVGPAGTAVGLGAGSHEESRGGVPPPDEDEPSALQHPGGGRGIVPHDEGGAAPRLSFAWYYRAMYAAVALGALLKGPVAIALPALAVVGFLIAQRDWRGLVRAIRFDGLLIAVAIAAPWFVLVSLRNPEFPSYFFLHEHLRRFSGTDERIRAWWYYLPIVFSGLAPWSVLGAFGVADWLRRRRWMPSVAACFCAIWAAVVLLLFSAAASKLGTYVLPLFPPAAILLARIVQRQIRARDPLAFTATGWALIVIGVACVIANPFFLLFWNDGRAAVLASRLLLGGTVLAIAGRLVLRAVEDRHLSRAVVAIACGTGVMLAVAMSGRAVSTGYRALSKAVAATIGPDDMLVSYSRYVRGLSFYTGKRAVVAGGWSELNFGKEQSPDGANDYFWDNNEPLIEAWNSDRRVILVIERTDLERLLPRFERPPIPIAAQHRRVAIANR